MAKFCHKCGKQVRETAKFCNFCGTILQKTQPRTATRKSVIQPQKRKVVPKNKVIRQRSFQRLPHQKQIITQNKVKSISNQEKFDSIIKSKLFRLEDQINHFEKRNRFTLNDYKDFQRNVDEILEYADNPLLESSQLNEKFQLIRRRKSDLVLKILEHITLNFADANLIKIRDTWKRIDIDEKQTKNEISHVLELERLGKQLNEEIIRLKNYIGKSTEIKINKSKLYATKPLVRRHFNNVIVNLTFSYIEVTKKSNHKDIFDEQIIYLKRLNELLNSDVTHHEQFTTKYLHSLSNKFRWAQDKTIVVLQTVLQSLLDHKKDLKGEFTQTKSKYINIMKKVIKSGVSPVIITSFDISEDLKTTKLITTKWKQKKKEKLQKRYTIPKIKYKRKYDKSKTKISNLNDLTSLKIKYDLKPFNPLNRPSLLRNVNKLGELQKIDELNEFKDLGN